MSNAIFNPAAYPGLEWNTTRVPVWSTTKRPAVSGREYRTANFSYPRYKFKVSFSFLRQTTGNAEMASLAGFFNARQGDFDTFLFTDPDDNSVTLQQIGTGDGSTKTFQLIRTLGGYAEPVFDVNSTPLIYVNGVLKTLTTDYTISATGLVTFVTAPGAALVVAYTGTYYRRVAFTHSQAEFNQFMKNLWELKSLEFISQKV